jgi:hypothetical protein
MLLVGFVIDLVLGVLGAHILGQFWAWFLAPQYGAGPTFASWYGALLLAAIFTFRRRPSEEMSWDIAKEQLIQVGALYLILLGLGAVAHHVLGIGA